MLFQRHRHRAGARRLVGAALAAVTVAVGSVGFLSASPASAVPVPPDVQAQLDSAVSTARAALQRTECSSLLKPSSEFSFTARDVLDTATFDFEPNPAPRLAGAAASVNDFGRFSTITIYQRFAGLGPQFTLAFAGRPELNAGFDGDLLRAIAILHEVGHLTGVEGPHEPINDEIGNALTAVDEEGLYNTRILNVCFAPRHLISSLACTSNVFYESTFNYGSTLDCSAICRSQIGPVTVAWSSNLSPNVVTDVRTSVDGGSCSSSRSSPCPTPGSSVTLAKVTLTVTDASGHTSADTRNIFCFPIILGGW